LAVVTPRPAWRQPNTSCRAPGLLGKTDLLKKGPTTPEAVIMKDLRSKARQELAAKEEPAMPRFEFDPFLTEIEESFVDRVEASAKSRLKKAMAEAGLA